MAGVVVNVMKKRSRREGLGDGIYEISENMERVMQRTLISSKPSGQGNVLKRMASARMPVANGRMTAEETAARTIQRNFRGYLLRQDMKGLVTENNLSDRSIVRALEIIARWHVGWNRFLIQGVVGIFLIITVYFQVFYQRPSGYEVNTALLDRLELKDFQKGVTEPSDVFGFLHSIVEEFYTAQVIDTPFCAKIMSQYCNTDTSSNDTVLEKILLDTCTDVKMDEAAGDLDYVDHTNRLVGASFVVQTRKKSKACSNIFNNLDHTITGVDSTKRKKRHQCLDEVEEADDFFVNVGCAAADCRVNITLPEFTIRPSPRNDFLFPLHVGRTRGLPFQAIQCRVDRMQRLKWVDYRTKQVCLIMGTYNLQEHGRILSYRECFSFLNGGRVENSRNIASNSFFADPTAALVMTWIMIILMVSKQIIATTVYIQERRAGHTRTRFSQPITVHNILGFMPALLILSGCVIFLTMVYSITKMGAESLDNKNTDITLDDFIHTLTQADWAVDLWVAYTTVVSIAMLMMLLKTLTLLDFHPTSAIVSGTLKRASGGLGCFFLIFALVVLGYAFVGMILLAVGEYQRMEGVIFYKKVDAQYVSIIQALYFWSYVLLVSILLMNLLLSIIVGSFVELQEKQEKTLDSRPILSFGRSLWTSIQFWSRGAKVYTIRAYRRFCGCCRNRGGPPPGAADFVKLEDEALLITPWEQLVNFPKQYYHAGWQGFESASEARKKLEIIFENEHTAELIISWCRAHSRLEKLQRYGHHLRGLDPDSDALKGHTVFMLESIMKRMGNGAGNFRSNKSVVSSVTPRHRQDDDQYLVEEVEREISTMPQQLEVSLHEDSLQSASFVFQKAGLNINDHHKDEGGEEEKVSSKEAAGRKEDVVDGGARVVGDDIV